MMENCKPGICESCGSYHLQKPRCFNCKWCWKEGSDMIGYVAGKTNWYPLGTVPVIDEERVLRSIIHEKAIG